MNSDQKFVSNILEASIRIGVLVLLVAWCYEIVKPFIIPIVWGIIIAVALYPAYLKLARLMAGRRDWRPL